MPQPDSVWRSLGRALTTMTQIFVWLGVGGVVGYLLDSVWPSIRPFGLFLGLLVGLLAGSLTAVRTVRKPDA